MITTAFVLAAGKGERLRPLTEKTPKPLLPIRGRPILDYIFEELQEAGIQRIVVNAWYLKEQILKYCVNYADKNYVNSSGVEKKFEILVSEENELLGTGGGLKKALPLIGSAPFLMLNGDCLWKGSLKGLLKSKPNTLHEGEWVLRPHEPDQTLIGVHQGEVSQIGKLWKSDKPNQSEGCFSGIQIFNRIYPRELPDVGCIIRQYWIPRFQNAARLKAREGVLDLWEDLGTADRLAKVEKDPRFFIA